MKPGSILLKAGTLSMVVLVAGCANSNWKWPDRMAGGNSTSYATGSYPAPARTASEAGTPPRSNGQATAADARVRSTTSANASHDVPTVQAAQQALSRFGYNPGATDGSWNSSTASAVTQFQKARGLQATGDLDSETRSALGLNQ